MKLLIISHTEHYTNDQGTLVGWGPTLIEINHLATIFDDIYHIGTFRNVEPPPSSLPYRSKNIHFIAMPFTGGKHWYQKLDILWNAPLTIFKVFKTLKKVDVFQLRTPTGIGVYLIPLLTLFSRKNGWYKYAGNWVQEKPPLGYALQRWFLKHQKRKVTINGKWNAKIQPLHCHAFENPCLVLKDLQEGLKIIAKKNNNAPYIFCFAGRLEDQKGVRRILEAFSLIKHKDKVKEVHLIGNGPELAVYKKMAALSEVHFVFHGFLAQQDVFDIYKKSDYFLLPSSASEGFPKVIAEAMNFGCIPIVSNVSAIGQYVIDDFNGYIVQPNTGSNLASIIDNVLQIFDKKNNDLRINSHTSIVKFTYQNYLDRIRKEIIGIK